MSTPYPRPGLKQFNPLGFLLIAGIALASFTVPSFAHRLGNYGTDILTRNSALILEGQIASLRSEWDPAGARIYTYIEVDVVTVHKGETSSDVLTLRYLGGTVGDMTLAVLEQPTFQEGEDVFLFLRPNFDVRDVPFVGGIEGKLAVSVDAATGRPVLIGHHQNFDREETVQAIARIVLPVGGK